MQQILCFSGKKSETMLKWRRFCLQIILAIQRYIESPVPFLQQQSSNHQLHAWVPCVTDTRIFLLFLCKKHDKNTLELEINVHEVNGISLRTEKLQHSFSLNEVANYARCVTTGFHHIQHRNKNFIKVSMTSLIYKQHNYKKSAHHKNNLLAHRGTEYEGFNSTGKGTSSWLGNRHHNSTISQTLKEQSKPNGLCCHWAVRSC